MLTKKKLMPGQPGTKKWVKEYGDKLMCVRYRYDVKNKKRCKTVELIVETEDWEPNPHRTPGNKIVDVQVRYGEIELGREVRAAGGIWSRDERVWKLPYREVLKLGLRDRIVSQVKPKEASNKNAYY